VNVGAVRTYRAAVSGIGQALQESSAHLETAHGTAPTKGSFAEPIAQSGS
jgi:hypothetical protein